MFNEKHYNPKEIKKRNEQYVYMFRQLGRHSKRTMIDLYLSAKDETEKEMLKLMIMSYV